MAAMLFAGLVLLLGLLPNVMAATPYPGYIFTASGTYAYLISPSGTIVHTWKATSSAQSNADLLPDGSALFPIQTTCTVKGGGAYPHGRLQQIKMYGPSYPGLKTYTSLKENDRAFSPCRLGTFVYNASTGTGKITVANSARSPLHLNIFSVSGKVVHSASINGSGIVFSTGALTPGVYSIDMRHDAGSFRSSFAKM